MSNFTRNIFALSALLIGGIIGTACSDTAAADTFFSWVAKGGELAFTDDEKQVPVASKEWAAEREFEDLIEKRTQMIITEKEQRDRLNKRLEYLREKNKVEPEAAPEPIVIITIEETRRRVRARGAGK